MATQRYGYEIINEGGESYLPLSTTSRLLNISDTQGGLTLEAFGVGVLKYPNENSLKVTAGVGLSVTISPGRGFAKHSEYGGFAFEIGTTITLTPLEANTTLYILAALNFSPDTRETGSPQIIVSATDTLDGGLLLAEVVTGASSIISITDLRNFVTLGGEGGSVWRTGATAPSNSLGNDGDFYLNTSNGNYYKKVSGAYELQGTLMGPQGPAGSNGTNGTDGEDGAQWLYGTGIPDNGAGNDGDWYLRTTNGAAYIKASGAWVYITNLSGPPGPAGGTLNWIDAGWEDATDYEVNDGLAWGIPTTSYRCKAAHTSSAASEPGIGEDWADYWMITAAPGGQGEPGAAGTKWYNGTSTPSGGLGADGDFYINTASSDIYKKISGTWTLQFNIKGIGMPTGGSAGDIPVKNSGTDYDFTWATPTSAATANAIAKRDGSGRIAIADGAASGDAVNKGQLDTGLSGKASSAAGVPTGGTTGQVLAKASGTDYATEWVDQAGGGGGGIEPVSVEQVAHDLSVGDFIRVTGNDAYAKAQADSAANAEIAGRVSNVTNSDNFEYLPVGPIVSGSGWTAGEVEFLSASAGGETTDTPPDTEGEIVKPVLLPINATQAILLPYVGYAVPGEAGSDADTLEGEGGSYYLSRANHTGSQAISTVTGLQSALDALKAETIIIAVSDETTNITTGTAKVTFRMPFAMTLSSVRASLSTASSSGNPTFDINENGSSILSTKLSIDTSEKTSTTAATAAVISDTGLADDAEITIDIDTAGTGAKGAKITLIGVRA